MNTIHSYSILSFTIFTYVILTLISWIGVEWVLFWKGKLKSQYPKSLLGTYHVGYMRFKMAS